MIAFETLLLGVVVGVVPVQLMVAPQVAAVVVQLDGRAVARVTGPPWLARCDLGPVPWPHELVAEAFDERGRRLGAARQLVNLARPEAEARLLVERHAGAGVLEARLHWARSDGADPSRVSLTLDGAPLTVPDPRRFVLPALDLAGAHLLSAELEFADETRARADAAFGAELADEAGAGLTGVPLLLQEGATLPPVSEMQRWIGCGSAPLRVVAVESGAAEVVVVLDEWSKMALLRMGHGPADSPLYRPRVLPPGSSRVLFVPAATRRVFDASGAAHDLMFRVGGYDLDLLADLETLQKVWVPEATVSKSLGHAVALAGIEATARSRRRAVVLLLAEEPEGFPPGRVARELEGAFAPAPVRRFLAGLRVPLFVWSLHASPGPVTAAWGGAELVSSRFRLWRAGRRVRRALDAQRIAWVQGACLPDQVHLSTSQTAVRLAGEPR